MNLKFSIQEQQLRRLGQNPCHVIVSINMMSGQASVDRVERRGRPSLYPPSTGVHTTEVVGLDRPWHREQFSDDFTVQYKRLRPRIEWILQ